MSWFSLKNLLTVAGLIWTFWNGSRIVGTKEILWGLAERPTLDFTALWFTVMGVVILYVSVFRLEPQGRLLGSAEVS